MEPSIDSAVLEALLREFDGDLAFLDQAIGFFEDEASRSLQSMETAAKEGDARAMASAAHKLRGDAANFGAMRLQTLCRSMEAGGNSAPGAADIVKEIRAELEKVLVELRDERKRLAD